MFGLDTPTLTMLMLALLMAAACGWLVLDHVGSDKVKTSARAHAIMGQQPTIRRRTAAEDSQLKRRKKLQKDLQTLQKGSQKFNVSERVMQAGIAMPPLVFFGMFLAGGVLVFLILAGMVHMHPLLALCFAATIALALPVWVLSFLRGRRMKKFTSDFPNAIDVIVRGIKSGLPVPECLQIIGRESPQPIAGEFTRLVENTSMGMDLEPALQKMYDRMPTPELNFFRVVIAIQKKTGGNLSEALGNLSTVIRARKMLREKVKALAAEAVSSAVIVASLPIFVFMSVMVMTPKYMIPLFTDPRGKMMLLGCLIWEVTGILFMRNMINFKY
jgi:tight adherence protein B